MKTVMKLLAGSRAEELVFNNLSVFQVIINALTLMSYRTRLEHGHFPQIRMSEL